MTKKPVAPPIPAPRVAAPSATKEAVEPTDGNNGQLKRNEKGHFIEGRWKKGESGNPAGRPRTSTEMKQIAAGHTDLALEVKRLTLQIQRSRLEVAMEILKDPDASHDLKLEAAKVIESKAAISAAVAMLDRGHGKPQQKVELDVNNAFDRMTDEELEQWLISHAAEAVAGIAAKRKAKK
jgi:uncharacterized protein DUF5681